MKKDIIGQPQLFMPETFNDCMTYYEQLNYLYNEIVNLEERVTKLEGGENDDTADISNT